ncbi:unnamed protein product [Aspergillus oryzae]|nr:unnamed protein product [Aspergillus oryzae]
MSAPGTTPPPGMQQANAQQPGRPAGFPANFQPPPNMPNINFSAPVIRLGTSGPSKSATPDTNKEREAPGRRAGLGSSNLETQRQNVRDAMMQLQPPTRDEIVRTLFVGGITEGVGGDEGIEKILRSAGNLRRWIRATDADEKPCKFGFAEYEDPESLGTAVEVLKDVEVVVDEGSLDYLEQYEASRGEVDPAERQSRLDAARSTLSSVLSELFHPSSPTQKEDVSAIDREGDTAMKDAEGQDGASAEVVTIPITVEDELSDIPPEMRETVAKEIAAFRERSNRRDIERLKREEEIESMERARNSGSRISRLASPPPTAPSGPAAGANGIPLGPRDRSMPNAPSGPKGFGVQIPKDYQKGVAFVNGGSVNGAPFYIDREDEDSDASDEELERRRQERKDAEAEKQFLDQERRWLNRERSRTAALEREKKRDKEEEAKLQEVREEADKHFGEWNDDAEASRKAHDYYADRGAWLRSRAAFRAREVSMDEADRAAEERERARSVQQREQARGMADDFLARQAEELETRTQAPREPQRFKLSLGAAAQKAQAATSRRTVAEVEGLLEDEEEPEATARRPLIPIKFDSAAEAAGLSEEERAQAARQLAAEIPTEKEGLWNWEVKWEFVDENVVSEQLKPFVEKKIVEYLGVQEQMLVDVVEEHVRKHGPPQELVEQLEEVSIFSFKHRLCQYAVMSNFGSLGSRRGGRSFGAEAVANDYLLLRKREERLVWLGHLWKLGENQIIPVQSSLGRSALLFHDTNPLLHENDTQEHRGGSTVGSHTLSGGKTAPMEWKNSSANESGFPTTSLDKTGSDAMNAAGDYSAAYCIIYTDSPHAGHGMTFTIGRGNEIVCAAISLLAPLVVGKDLDELTADWGKTWRHLVSDSQLRWIGPEKGVIHLALGAIVNALWDLWAKTLGKPVWRIVAEMTPEEFVRCIDFRYITDAITPEEAIALLKEVESGKEERIKEAEQSRAVPAYTTSAGWLGYSEDKLKALLKETVQQGYRHFKLKVGGNIEDDKRRLRIAREAIGYDKGNILMVDANQAISWMHELAEFKPWFIEEPTSPDDILGHAAIKKALENTPHGPIGVATGEMCQNRVIFKQLLQAGALTVLQADACRVGGVNEVLAILLLARKFGVPIVPHSGGVGLPEYTQHLSTIDYVVVSGKKSVLEYVDHLHEHFVHPSSVKDGYYVTPLEPGYSVEMKPESMDEFAFPGEQGKSWWTTDAAKTILEGPRI